MNEELESEKDIESTLPETDKKPLELNPKREKSKKKNKFLIGGAVLLSLSALSVGSFYGYEWYVNKDNVQVPEAISYIEYGSETTSEEICANFEKASLRCEVNWTTDEKADRGNLLNQSIASGEEVKPNSKVSLSYSSGPASSEFPNLVGQDLKESEEALYELGISVSEVSETEGDGIAAGRIVSTSIDPGATVENGTEVAIKISTGATEIPNWEGKSRDFVEADAQKYGLTVEYVEETSESVSPGLVISQSPKAGEIIEEDSTVSVNIAKPIEIVQIEIPKIIGMSPEEAQSQLAVAGFTKIKIVNVNSSSVDSPQVTEIVPGEGQKTATDDQLVVIVSQPEEAPASADTNNENTTDSEE